MTKPVSRSRSALLGTISSQAFTIVSMLVSIISTPLMLRYLSKDAYGLSILFFQISNYLSTLDFGVSSAVMRQLAMHRGEDEQTTLMINRVLSTGIIATGILGAVVPVITFFFAPFIPSIYNLSPELASDAVPIICWMGLLSGIQFLQRAPGGLFFAHHRQALIGIPVFTIALTGTILTVVLLAYGVGLWSFVYSTSYQLVLTIVFQYAMLRHYYPRLRISPTYFDRAVLRELFSYGIFIFINCITGLVIVQTDRLVVGKIVSLAAVSVFSITIRIPEVVIGLISKIMDNISPALVEINTHESNEQAQAQYQRILMLVSSLSTLSFWLMLSLNEWFIDLWVGPAFFAGYKVLVLALILMVEQALVRAGSSFLYARGISRSVSLMGLVEAPINVCLSIFLGYRIGLPGILLGTLLASLLTSVWFTPYLLNRHMGLKPYSLLQAVLKPVIGISLVGGLTYAMVWGLRLILPNSILLFGAVSVLVGSILAVFTWLVFLRYDFATYVPAPWRRYLLVNA